MDSDLPIAWESRWHSAGGLGDSVRRLATELPAMEAALGLRIRRRRPVEAARFAACLDSLLCNFAAIAQAAPGRALATARRTKAEGSDVHGKVFVGALDTLEGCGLIHQWRGGWCSETNRHEISRSRATAALAYYLPTEAGAECLRAKAGPLLELRSSKDAAGQWRALPLPSDAKTEKLAQEVDDINAVLARADIARRGAQLWVHQRAAQLPYIAGTVLSSLRRVFNDGTLAHGGRLVGGWWQSMSSAERRAEITINGEPIVELDYSAAVPGICYALCGVAWPFGDDSEAAYTAGPEAPREAWKKLTLAMLNAGSMMRNWPGTTAAERIAFGERFGGLTAAAACAKVLAHHSRLTAAGAFGRGLGMAAMRTESDIATAVLLALRARGVVALPVHDSFCVPAGQADVAAHVMRGEARRMTGADFTVTAKGH